jgi:hypothetical protein
MPRGTVPNARAVYEADLFESGAQQGVIRVPEDATFYEVQHEVQHAMSHVELGSDYFNLTPAAREYDVYNALQQSPYWDSFMAEEQIDAYKQVMTAINRRQ